MKKNLIISLGSMKILPARAGEYNPKRGIALILESFCYDVPNRFTILALLKA